MKKIIVLVSVFLVASPALAKILVFKDGRRMEVRDYTVRGELVYITMLDGEETSVQTPQVDLEKTDRANRPPTPTPQVRAERTPSLVELARIERLRRERQNEQERTGRRRAAEEPTEAPETPVAAATPEPTATPAPVPSETPTPVPTETAAPQVAVALQTPPASLPPGRSAPPGAATGGEKGGRNPLLSFIPGGNTGLLILAGAGTLLLGLIVGIVIVARRKKRPVIRPRAPVLAPKAAPGAAPPGGTRGSALEAAEDGSLSKELESMEFREEREPATSRAGAPAAESPAYGKEVGEEAGAGREEYTFGIEEEKAEPSFAEELKAEGPAFGGEGEEEETAPSSAPAWKPGGREPGGETAGLHLELPHEVREEAPSQGETLEGELPFREETGRAASASPEKAGAAESELSSAGAAGIFRDEKDIQIRIDNEVYICPDVQTLKTWVSEGRVIENSEVLAPNGAWLLAGTIPDLEQSFELRRKNLGF